MQLLQLLLASAPLAARLAHGAAVATTNNNNKREESGFAQGDPISSSGKGAPLLGGTNEQVDLDNPSNLGAESTDNGVVPNLKWRFSDSHVKLSNGGWTREQVVTDLPSSHDIAAAQQHLRKGAIRELHWHRVAEWGWVYAGRVLVSAVDEEGRYTASILHEGDVWYFPKGAAHTVQGLDDENEYLLIFDDGDFDKIGTTFMVDDWLAHTPRAVVAKNFGVDPAVFDNIPETDPYILKANYSDARLNVTAGAPLDDELRGDNAYVYFAAQHALEPVPGGAGTFRKVDSTTFPIAKTISAAFVTLEPKGLRELHWHPNAEEWLYFHKGEGRASVFIGNAASRTFDFSAGDTAVFPDNSGHYIENTSETETLEWVEIYKSDRVADISLTQWLALTPPDVVASVLKVPVAFAEKLKKEKQVLVKGN